MKSLARKLIPIMIGLVLGWYVAGVATPYLPTASFSYASEQPAKHQELQHEAVHDTHQTQTQHMDDHAQTGHVDAHAEAPDAKAAGELVPAQGIPKWYRPVIMGIAGLFVAAIVIGLLGKSLGISEPSAKAAQADQALAHGHDHHSN